MKRDKKSPVPSKKRQGEKGRPICVNKNCKIRRAGCEGSQECPGYRAK